MSRMEYVLSLSYGKDSLACLEAIRLLGYPLDRIITAEVWATDTIPADLPPMVEFKKKADKIIKERYGITVEHTSAKRERERERLSFEKQFYAIRQRKCGGTSIYGFPVRKGQWCTSKLKTDVLDKLSKIILRNDILPYPTEETVSEILRGYDNRISTEDLSLVQQQTQGKSSLTTGFSLSPEARGANTNVVQYLGIAADEPERIERHRGKPGIMLPLVDIGWDEAYCRKWCEENDLLSPIYTDSARGGCWFCHNQRVDQLRLLRQRYPEYWTLLLKWDKDSPVTFHADGRTVHDFEKRFSMEDFGLVPANRKFRWKMLEIKQNEWLELLLDA